MMKNDENVTPFAEIKPEIIMFTTIHRCRSGMAYGIGLGHGRKAIPSHCKSFAWYLCPAEMEQCFLKQCIDPSGDLPVINFLTELLCRVSKKSDAPRCLLQFALEIINCIPEGTTLEYTDGSKYDGSHSGSGAPIKDTNGIVKVKKRNPDFFLFQFLKVDSLLSMRD
ncbi:hypothetical protein TNCV_2987491 [Trichonephila clavipes]|nr:hypothetical protein TNCV_2987491 [Trichonephila clavipes]